MMNSDRIVAAMSDSSRVINETSTTQSEEILKACIIVEECLLSGGCIFWCGNGGSAADSDHMATELVGRFKKERNPLRSISLTSSSSLITCISNDYKFEEVFSRQLEALGTKKDILIVLSTSGTSNNVLAVLHKAKSLDIQTIGLFGSNDSRAKELCTVSISVQSNETARVQEVHKIIGHIICESVDGVGA